MRKLLEKLFTLLLLGAGFVGVYGRLIVLHGKEERKEKDDKIKKLLCISDEDGGALVWNFHLESEVEALLDSRNQNKGVKHYYNRNYSGTNSNKYGMNCMLHEHNDCMAGWTTKNWKLVSSVYRPMGPVFDRRWEGFMEGDNFGPLNASFTMPELNKTGSVVLSIRGYDGVHLALCNGKNYKGSFCYWTVIGGAINTMSLVRKCPYGLPVTYPPADPECLEDKETYEHQALSTTEWRTYILSWNETDHSIELYDRKKRILRYVDTGDRSLNTNNHYYLYVRSLKPIIYRLHFYNFFQTSNVNAVLSSPEVFANTRNICLQMVIGLCTQCAMEIFLADAEDTAWMEKLQTVNGSTVAQEHGLPMWQNVKINATIPENFGYYVHIKFVPKLEGNVEDRVWAIADVHECTPEATITIATLNATKAEVNSSEGLWPNVTCQKFSYDGDYTVRAVADTPTNIKSDDDYYCPNGRTGLHCLIDCKADLGLSEDCLEEMICEDGGCFCRPGLYGNNCDSYCEKGKYGHACTESCDNCLLKDCDSITGRCRNGCDNTINYHIPPFCKTEIVLPKPDINFINETWAQVSLMVRDDYNILPDSYTFEIQSQGGENIHGMRMIVDRKEVTGYFTLRPGTTYIVRAVLTVDDGRHFVYSPDIKFTTLCNPSRTFDVTPYETSLILTNVLQRHATYPCPAKWYNIFLEEILTGIRTLPKLEADFPLKFVNLSSSTFYKVKVYRSNITFFERNVSTVEKGPSMPRNLRNTSVSSTHITLKWDRPAEPNGIITKYLMNCEAFTYLGCEDLNRSAVGDSFLTQTQERTITFTDLHPYTMYVITIVARSTKYGAKAEVNVTTNPLETPTAVVSGLTFLYDTLAWDDPFDCRTITGPIEGTKIIFNGVSKNVISFYDEKHTSSYSFQLGTANQVIYGAETYMAKVYVMRKTTMKYNESAYAELTFTTLPKVPPPVRNLERFEMDSIEKTLSIRWKEPQPPTNGQIEYYTIIYCGVDYKNASVITTIPFSQTCKIWNDYICATFKQPTEEFTYIAVRAHNINVSEGGRYVYLQEDLKETLPSAPEYFESIILDGAVVELNWTHPWKPAMPFNLFLIISRMDDTKLRGEGSPAWRAKIHEHIITRQQLHYVDRLYLKPSSIYTLAVYARGKWHGESKAIEVHTPSCLAFESELKWKMYSMNATIRLDIPRLLNDTVHSAMYVVVMGPRPCVEYSQVDTILSEQIGITDDESSWVAALLSTSEFSGATFIVGDNRVYGNATNCPLYTGGTYSVIVAVQSEKGSLADQVIIARTPSIYVGNVSSRRVEAWVGPIVIFFVVSVALILYRQRRKRNVVRKIDDVIEM